MPNTVDFPLPALAEKLRLSSKPKSMDHNDNLRAADLMEKNDIKALSNHLRGLDTAARDFILDFVHPRYWSTLGFEALHPDYSVSEFLNRFKDKEDRPRETPPRPSNMLATDVGDYQIRAYVDADGHLTLSVQSKDGSPVMDIGEDVSANDKEFAVRLTTGQVERQEVKNTNRPRG